LLDESNFHQVLKRPKLKGEIYFLDSKKIKNYKRKKCSPIPKMELIRSDKIKCSALKSIVELIFKK
jgi:hypothetical protein